MEEFPLFAVVTIEGGGAFGFSLLGQLQSLVDRKIIPIAFAGTSAGAIIATLHWAGYTPIDIRNMFCELADEAGVVSLLGPFDNDSNNTPFNFPAFEKILLDVKQLLQDGKRVASYEKWRGKVTWVWNTCTLKSTRDSCGTILKVRREIKRLRPQLRNRGLFSGERLVERLDEWLRSAPNLSPSARAALAKMRGKADKVTFGDFAAISDSRPFPPLFLPVTNVTGRKLELVCSIDANYANWSIARAVRASAGFPLFFKPVTFGHAPEESQFVDGGVIANYPGWIFGHQFRQTLYNIEAGREIAIRPWIHVGLCLGAPKSEIVKDEDRGRTPWSFISRFGGLLTGGARQELEKRLVGLISRSIEIRQPEDETDAPASLLDIASCDKSRIKKMFKRGRAAGKDAFNHFGFTYPPARDVEEILGKLVKKSLVCFGQVDRQGEVDNSQLHIRANVFMPGTHGVEDWKIRYSVNMNGDTDREMELPKFAGLTGMCCGMRLPLICNLEQIRSTFDSHADAKRLFGMPTDRQTTVRDDRTWLASVPIFDHFAVYPSRLADRVGQFAGNHFKEFDSLKDGAVIGVLNLDAALSFSDFNLSSHPEAHWKDIRIQSIIDVMRAVADDLGATFSKSFGCRKEIENG